MNNEATFLFWLSPETMQIFMYLSFSQIRNFFYLPVVDLTSYGPLGSVNCQFPFLIPMLYLHCTVLFNPLFIIPECRDNHNDRQCNKKNILLQTVQKFCWVVTRSHVMFPRYCQNYISPQFQVRIRDFQERKDWHKNNRVKK